MTRRMISGSLNRASGAESRFILRRKARPTMASMRVSGISPSVRIDVAPTILGESPLGDVGVRQALPESEEVRTLRAAPTNPVLMPAGI